MFLHIRDNNLSLKIKNSGYELDFESSSEFVLLSCPRTKSLSQAKIFQPVERTWNVFNWKCRLCIKASCLKNLKCYIPVRAGRRFGTFSIESSRISKIVVDFYMNPNLLLTGSFGLRWSLYSLHANRIYLMTG